MSLPWMFQYNMFVLLVWAGIVVLLGIVRAITDAVSMGKRAITASKVGRRCGPRKSRPPNYLRKDGGMFSTSTGPA